MNSLRVRLSLSFMGVILLVLAIPFVINIFLFATGLDDLPNNVDGVPEEVWERLRQMTLRMLPGNLLRLTLLTAVVGSIAGILISRSLTAPLFRLQEALRDVGDQNLSQRVSVEGSSEIQALATTFNTMASKLETTEALRQNMLADVAHELRTPITVIQGNLRAILDDVYPLEKDEVARLYDQTRQLTRLVDDLHELTQAEARRLPLDKSDVNVAELVQETAAYFQPLMDEYDINLRVELLGRHPVVQADRQRLIQVMQNLLNNARRHTPAGGRILIQVEQLTGMVDIRVTDSGDGIAPEHLPYVFDRFYRTDAARARDDGGVGLGLALVRAIIEAHDGHVKVTSEGPQAGTTFTICLPA